MPAKKSAPKKEKPPAGNANVWAFIGTDDLAVKEAATDCWRKIISPEEAEFGLEIIEGAADNADHVERIVHSALEALRTYPLFGGQKVVWLRGITFLADTPTGRSEPTQNALASLQAFLESGVPPDIHFILSASEVDKRRSFFLSLKKVARLEVLDLIDASKKEGAQELEALTTKIARELGISFEPDALLQFTMLAGEDSRQIRNELAKLDLYLGADRHARLEDVRAIVSPTKAGVIFSLGNALGRRNLDECLHLLDRLIAQKESPIAILLAAIVPKVRNLFQAKILEERCRPSLASYAAYSNDIAKLPEKERARLPMKKDGSGPNVFPLFLAAQEARGFTSDQLRLALAECLKANRRLVTTSLDGTLVLNQLLISILGPKRSSPPTLPRR